MMLPSTYVLKTDNTTNPFAGANGLIEVNDHLKESFTDLSTEVYLLVLIQAVKEYGEEFTWRTFLNKVFTLYLTEWKYSYELRRSKLVSVASVKYIDEDGVTQTVDAADYSTSFSDEFSYLFFDENYTFPSLTTNNPQPVIIEFTAGYGVAGTNIPNKIRTAMLQHLAQLWKHRGDCVVGSPLTLDNFIGKHLPPASQLIYSMEKILDITI